MSPIGFKKPLADSDVTAINAGTYSLSSERYIDLSGTGYRTSACLQNNGVPDNTLIPERNDKIYPPPTGGNLRRFPAFAIDQVRENGGAPVARSLSLTEPLGGYVGESDIGAIVFDVPFDLTNDLIIDGLRTEPMNINSVTLTGQRVVHLQRLADPSRPFDAATNPYRTVDSSFVDITFFNGVSAETVDPPAALSIPTRFYAKQRGDDPDPTANLRNGVYDRALWPIQLNRDIRGEPNSAMDTSDSNHFNFYCRSSLGYLNDGYRMRDTGEFAFQAGDSVVQQNPDFLGAPAPGADAPPFPNLPWNNRPYISQYELALVPKTSSYNLLRTYSLPANPDAYGDVFGNTNPIANPAYLNFFGMVSDGNGGATGLRRLLDLCHVPSRFMGTYDWLSTDIVEFDFDENTGDPRAATLRPPFNRISRMREPGKVNLNTICDQTAWDAVASGYPVSGYPTWWDIERSIRGHSNAATPGGHLDLDLTSVDGALPSQFANPFRSGFSASLMAAPAMGGFCILQTQLNS